MPGPLLDGVQSRLQGVDFPVKRFIAGPEAFIFVGLQGDFLMQIRLQQQKEGDLSEVGDTGETYDRAILDLPQPWSPLPALSRVLVPGGIVCGKLGALAATSKVAGVVSGIA